MTLLQKKYHTHPHYYDSPPNALTIPIAATAATPPTNTISTPPLTAFPQGFFPPSSPSSAATNNVFPSPNANKQATITPTLHANPTNTSPLFTKKYGINGINPPKKYPAAIVTAEDSGVLAFASGAGRRWWNCSINDVRVSRSHRESSSIMGEREEEGR